MEKMTLCMDGSKELEASWQDANDSSHSISIP